MPKKTPSPTPKRASSQLERQISAFLIAFAWTCMPPALFGQQDPHAALLSPANRKPAPAFQLLTDSGGKIRISDYRGRVVLLNFWATACGGCVLEIPSFIDIQNTYKDKGFTAIGVSMDISYEGLKDDKEAWGRVRPFMAKRGINYPIAMGDEAISKAYSLNAFPATYLIDKSGRIAVAYVGVVVNKDNAATNINNLLSEH